MLIGDLMKSVEVLEYDNVLNQLKSLAKDYQQQWVAVADMMSRDRYVVFDMSNNLSVLKKRSVQPNVSGSAEEAKTLQVVAEFHLGDSVNQFKKGKQS